VVAEDGIELKPNKTTHAPTLLMDNSGLIFSASIRTYESIYQEIHEGFQNYYPTIKALSEWEVIKSLSSTSSCFARSPQPDYSWLVSLLLPNAAKKPIRT